MAVSISRRWPALPRHSTPAAYSNVGYLAASCVAAQFGHADSRVYFGTFWAAADQEPVHTSTFQHGSEGYERFGEFALSLRLQKSKVCSLSARVANGSLLSAGRFQESTLGIFARFFVLDWTPAWKAYRQGEQAARSYGCLQRDKQLLSDSECKIGQNWVNVHIWVWTEPVRQTVPAF